MFLAAALSLYFIFPPLDPMQAELSNALGNEEYSSRLHYQQAVEIQEEYEKVAYLDVEENPQLFPDEYFDSLQEEFDAGKLLNDLENEEDGSEFDSLLQEKVSQKIFLNSQNVLRLYTYGQEHLSVYRYSQGSTGLVSVNNELVVRNLYDSSNRIIEKNIWKNASTLSDSKLLKSIKYAYNVSAPVEFMDKPIMTISYDYENRTSVETKINEFNLPYVVLTYTIPEEMEKKTLLLKTERKYDNEGRLVFEEEIKYGEDAYTKRNVYKYTEKSEYPDYEYYEDGKLRIKDVYESNEKYTETVFFDDGYSVKVYFENGKKVLEQFFENNVEIRRRTY